MGYFNDSDEALKYLGGMFEKAKDHPEAGPKMAAAGLNLRIGYTDPECEITVKFQEPMEVIYGQTDVDPDISLFMPCDIADQYWRGNYNLAVGLAKGQVKAKGPVNKILKMVPLTKPLFPMYQDMIAEKDNQEAAA